MPLLNIFLPFAVVTRLFNDNHKGNPIIISSSIAPNAHISYDHGVDVVLRSFVEQLFFVDNNFKTSGGIYSGVAISNGMLSSNWYDEPKSIIFIESNVLVS